MTDETSPQLLRLGNSFQPRLLQPVPLLLFHVHREFSKITSGAERESQRFRMAIDRRQSSRRSRVEEGVERFCRFGEDDFFVLPRMNGREDERGRFRCDRLLTLFRGRGRLDVGGGRDESDDVHWPRM